MIPLGIMSRPRELMPTFVTEAVWTASSVGTVTFSNVPLGAPVDRTVIIGLGIRVASGGTTVAVTVAGQPAIVEVKNLTHTAAAIARVVLPAGVTSGDVVVTTGGSWYRRISVFFIPGVIVRTSKVLQYKDNSVQANAPTFVSGTLTPTDESQFTLAQFGSNPSWGGSDVVWTGIPEHGDDGVNLSRALGQSAASQTDIMATVAPNTSRYLGLAAASYRAFDPNEPTVLQFTLSRGNGATIGSGGLLVRDSGGVVIANEADRDGLDSYLLRSRLLDNPAGLIIENLTKGFETRAATVNKHSTNDGATSTWWAVSDYQNINKGASGDVLRVTYWDAISDPWDRWLSQTGPHKRLVAAESGSPNPGCLNMWSGNMMLHQSDYWIDATQVSILPVSDANGAQRAVGATLTVTSDTETYTGTVTANAVGTSNRYFLTLSPAFPWASFPVGTVVSVNFSNIGA